MDFALCKSLTSADPPAIIHMFKLGRLKLAFSTQHGILNHSTHSKTQRQDYAAMSIVLDFRASATGVKNRTASLRGNRRRQRTRKTSTPTSQNILKETMCSQWVPLSNLFMIVCVRGGQSIETNIQENEETARGAHLEGFIGH